MRHQNVLVLGGSGFIGSHVVSFLAAEGRRVLVPARRRDHAKHLILLPTVEVIEANVHDDTSLRRLVEGQDAVINLVGILHGSRAKPYGPEFADAHVALPRRLLAACAAAHVSRVLHMSALGADTEGPSMYLRSKGDGEKVVRASATEWTIFQPSVVFGIEDDFLNTFAHLARLFPVLPIGRAQSRMQPVWVEDLAHAIVNTLDKPETFQRAYELAGPKIYTLKELVEFAAAASGHPRPVIALPDALAWIQAAMMEMMPGAPLVSRDNLDSLTRDSVASVQPYKPAPELGIGLWLTPLEAEASLYLAGLHPRTRFGAFRARAGR